MLEYKEKIYFNCWWVRYEQVRKIPFRYRFDPIPYTGKAIWAFSEWYKNFHLYKRERSLYNEHKEYVRDKRSPKHLPDPWDDIQRGDIGTRKSWKNKKVSKQWMKNMGV